MRGYYSLVQYCPDATRAEVVNVGVVMICPEKGFVGVAMANANHGVRRMFGVEGEMLERINTMKCSLRERIMAERVSLASLEAFEHFIGTRGNKLLLTPPRNMRVEDLQSDLRRLFETLVGGRAMGDKVERSERGKSVRSQLREIFARPELKGKIAANVPVTPKYGRPFKAPYAFFNGKDSFISPQTIHHDRDQTLREAELLAMRGIQLRKHGLNGREAELIVPLPEPVLHFASQTQDVIELLRDSDIRTVLAGGLDDFAEEIELHAHAIPA